jgi:hypothetical protein
LRARGQGTVLTTLQLRAEPDATELLGIPDGVQQVTLLPMAYTIGTDFKSVKRPAVSEITHWKQW